MGDSAGQRTIRWGIIGLGNIAGKFSDDLIKVKGAQLYAVASRSQSSAETFAKKYGAQKAYDSYHDLVTDPNIDAVYIATPHAFHKEHTLLCLEHGLAVLCEKPLAMNITEVNEMISKAREKRVLLMEALWTYFLPNYRHVLSLIKQQHLGKVLRLEVDFGFASDHPPGHRLFDKSLGGGSLLDIGVYPIFVALSSLGEPDVIKAEATFFENGVDSSCTMHFEYTNSALAILRCSLLETTPTEAVFYCEDGIIKINSKFFAPSSVSLIQNGIEQVIPFENTSLGYRYEILHFNELIRQGKTESDIMSFHFSSTLMGLLDAVRKKIGLSYDGT